MGVVCWGGARDSAATDKDQRNTGFGRLMLVFNWTGDAPRLHTVRDAGTSDGVKLAHARGALPEGIHHKGASEQMADRGYN